jgi:molybdenum cofactor cytidylyltransferase
MEVRRLALHRDLEEVVDVHAEFLPDPKLPETATRRRTRKDRSPAARRSTERRAAAGDIVLAVRGEERMDDESKGVTRRGITRGTATAPPDAVRVKRPGDVLVAGVLLAAGASSRFGSPKLLAAVDERGTPLIRKVLETWTNAGFEEVIVVVRPEDPAFGESSPDFYFAAAADAAADRSRSGGPNPPVKGAQSAPRSGQRPLTAGFGAPRVRFVENPRWEAGMFTSVKAGLAATAAGRSTHVAVSPADLPFLRGDSLRRVIAAAAEVAERTLVVPTHAGRRGHPLVFPASLVPRILSWPDDRRLSDLFEEPDLSILHMDGFDEGILRDVDRVEDLSPSSTSRKGNATA